MLIEYPVNRFDKMLDLLKAEKEKGTPLVVAGGGGTAKKVIEYLEKKELNVNCVLINREYYNDEKKISGKNVYILDEYLKSNRCNLVIAYGGYNETDIPDFCIKNIANLFDYDFPGKLALSIMDDDSITAQYLESRQKDVKWIYSVLEDDKSEKALDSFLYQRIYGNISKEYDENQYFQDDIISVSENEIFIDCGAYHGESINDFLKYLRKQNIYSYDKIIAFEPEPENVEIMKRNIANIENVVFEQAGVYKETTTLKICSGSGSNSMISDDGDVLIQVESIDDVLNGNKATFVKMDIEGSEIDALMGARRTIKQYRPKLAISVYHKKGDFIDIPRYILSINPDYKIYMRNHSPSGIELVMYAI